MVEGRGRGFAHGGRKGAGICSWWKEGGGDLLLVEEA